MTSTASSARTPRPQLLPLLAENLPLDELRLYSQFVAWELEWREGKNGKPGKWTKVPKNPRSGGNASSRDPQTWGVLDDVLGRFERIGFVLTENDPFTFIDVD